MFANVGLTPYRTFRAVNLPGTGWEDKKEILEEAAQGSINGSEDFLALYDRLHRGDVRWQVEAFAGMAAGAFEDGYFYSQVGWTD
jgi:hypothetical protein